MSNLTFFLRSEHQIIGLTLQDEDIPPKRMFLQKDGTVVKTFEQYATLEEIRHEADQYVEQAKSGIEFRKVTKQGDNSLYS